MNEKELKEEIKALDQKASTNKLVWRQLTDSDWETLKSWWAAWPDWPVPPAKDFLPQDGKGGIMIEKDKRPIVAGFLYQTNSKGILLEWIISDPDYRDADRDTAVEMLISQAEQISINMGYKYMFTIGRNPDLTKKHEKLGWSVDKKPSYEIAKVISGPGSKGYKPNNK